MLVQEVAQICGSSGGLACVCEQPGRQLGLLNELEVHPRSSVE